MCIGKQDVRTFWATSLHQCDHCIGGRKLFIVVAVQSSVFSGLFTFAIFILLILVVFLDGLVGIVADIWYDECI